MVTCDQQEKVLSSQKVLLGIFLQIRNLIKRYAELNRLTSSSNRTTALSAAAIILWTTMKFGFHKKIQGVLFSWCRSNTLNLAKINII